MSEQQDDDASEVDPREFMRKMLAISPEDAADVRRDSPATPARTRRKNADSAQRDQDASGDLS